MRSAPNLPDIFLNQREYRINSLMKNIYHTSCTYSIIHIYLTGRIIRIITSGNMLFMCLRYFKKSKVFCLLALLCCKIFKFKLNLKIYIFIQIKEFKYMYIIYDVKKN